MSDVVTEQKRPQVKSPLRPGAWLLGGMLWIAAILAAVGIWITRNNDAATESPAGRFEMISEEPVTGEDGRIVLGSSPWDENGIENFKLTERSGREVTKDDLLGKPWVIGFIFTRCAGPCPRVTGAMKKLQDAMEEEDVRLVTLTVDPNHDNPEVLTRYADAFKADQDKWLFLTGPQKEVYTLIQDSFNMPVQEMTGPDRQPGFEVLHTSNLLLVDAEGVVQGKYNAIVPEEMAKLRRDFQRLARRS
ncbi:SCO family protein [Calycomorphotria hydatis]|uniref:SCO family protein n=1 Tax=Calycomorphotria hydatis TaxID=2528027 RepID=UPI0011AA91CF|nr:SCO family protein [Calycomorphotria hydatis]